MVVSCEICGKQFDSFRGLNGHRNAHIKRAESFTPPASAVKAAKKGLAQRKEWGRGGLSPSEAKAQGIDSGVTRARKIASGSVSRHDVRRMSAFNRHRKNNRPDKKMPDGGPTAGTIAWNLWGGTSGVNWAKKKSAAMNAESSEENFACTDYIIEEIKRIWYSPAQKDIKHWAEHSMAGGGLGAYYDRFDLPDGSELSEDTTKDEYFERMFDIFLERFEEGTWMYSDDDHGIMMQAWRVLYVPVGTPVNVDSLGNWENRHGDQYGVYGDKITSWVHTQEIYAGAIFGHEGIDHMKGEEGKDFDRIVLTAWIPWEAVDWASTIAYNISIFWQENELCVRDKEPVYELNYDRNSVDEASLDKAMNAETLDYNSFTNDMEALLAKYSQLLLTYETEYQSKERGGDGIMEVFMRFKPYNAYFDDVDFDSESFGPVDEEGQLAKALAAVREKSKRYAPAPLRLTKLPHPDQKTLKDFEADEWKLLPRDAKGRWQKPVRSESINELRDSLQTSVPAISELLEMYGGDTPNNRYKLYNDLQSLKIDAMDSALPDDSTASLDMDDMSWMTPSEYYQYVLEEPLDISDDIEDDTQTIEFQDRFVRYTAMTMSPQVIDALIEENELEIVSDLFADPAEAEGEIAFLKAVKRYQRFSEEYSAE